MSFLLELAQLDRLEPAEMRSRLDRYRAYLLENQPRMPARAHSFAQAEWHYDARDHRCLHDSWVDAVLFMEVATGSRSEHRQLNIEVKLLGAYHDGYTLLRYEGVQEYSLVKAPSRPQSTVGHGDWLIDEVRLDDAGLVVHEIVFSEGARWRIECADIVHESQPNEAGSRTS